MPFNKIHRMVAEQMPKAKKGPKPPMMLPESPNRAPIPAFKSGGSVSSSASKRGDGIAVRGKTKCKMY